MSRALPSPTACGGTRCATVTVNIPGAQGGPGIPGAAGANGINAFTTLSAAFVMPAELATVTVVVGNSTWAVIGQVAVIDGSYFQVVGIPTSTSLTLQNLEDAANAAYATNVAPGTTITAGNGVSPGGIQGARGDDLILNETDGLYYRIHMKNEGDPPTPVLYFVAVLFMLLFFLASTVFGQNAGTITVMARTNGPVLAPLKFFYANIVASNGIVILQATNGVNAGAIVIGADGGYYILSNSGKGTNTSFWGVTETHGALVGDSTASFTDLLTALNGLAVFNGATIFSGLTVPSGTMTGNGNAITNLPSNLTNGTHLSVSGLGGGLATLSAGYAVVVTNEARTNISIAVDPSVIPLYGLNGVGPTFASLVDGQVLSYNAAAGKWTNATAAGTTATATNALTSINGMTNAAQYIESTENSNNVSVSSLLGTNRINIPVASATKTGKISSNDWTTFNLKPTQAQLATASNTVYNFAAGLTDGGALFDVPFADGAGGLEFDTGVFTYDNGTGDVFANSFNGNFNGGQLGGNGAGITNLPSSLTNATHISPTAGSKGLKTFGVGYGLSVTNESGTNIVPAVNRTIIAAQTDLNSASNYLQTNIFSQQIDKLIPFYKKTVEGFNYDTNFYWSTVATMLSSPRLQMSSNPVVVPTAGSVGMGGSRMWTSNGTLWVSCTTNGTTLFNQQIAPFVPNIATTLYVSTTSTANSAGLETTLFSYTVPANTLSVNKQRLKIRMNGTTSAANAQRAYKVHYGSTLVSFEDIADDGTNLRGWIVDMEVTRTGASAQIISANHSYPATTTIPRVTVVGATENNAADNDVTITGTSSSGSVITGLSMSVELWPAP